ncbi:MAG TPA: DUF6799 domain-containing protein [Hanamia sp.]|nr:DUF6799 domain-containing protein [Hanamia sp.]
MKRIFSIIVLVFFIISCNNSSSNSQTGSDSSHMKMNSSIDSMSSISKVSEGTMAMRNGKMHVMTGGKWELMSQPVTCTDKCQVLTNGQVIMENGQKMTMKEGEMIDKEGYIIDANGKMMDNEKMEMNDSMK